MSLKYALGPAADLQEIADALDGANNLIDDQGNRTPIPATIIIAGQDVTGDPRFDPNAQGNGIVLGTFTVVGAITTDPDEPSADDSCLALDYTSQAIAPYLGTDVDGVAIPAAAELVEADDLPPGLHEILFPPLPEPPAPPEDPPEATATIKVDVQMRDDDGDGRLEPHISTRRIPD